MTPLMNNFLTCDDPLIVFAVHFFPVGLAKYSPCPVLVEVTKNDSDIIFYQFIQLVLELIGERLGLQNFKFPSQIQQTEEVIVGLEREISNLHTQWMIVRLGRELSGIDRVSIIDRL